MSAAARVDVAALAAALPDSFTWGVAAAAYQIEGSPDADGKGPSIWDAFCRVPGAIANSDTGDVACDHYRRFRDDVALLAELGVPSYRFSISWPRVLPDGIGRVNERGLAFYERLVDELLEHGIRPFATLYHWDLPQALQDRGGWGTRASVDWLAEYASVVGSRLGDRVLDWITVNEPAVVAFVGHAEGRHAPGMRDQALALRVAHHLLLGHRAVTRELRRTAAAARVGIALDLRPTTPATPNAEDAAAARRVDGARSRWFLDPLFGRGYPADAVALYERLLPTDALDEMGAFEGELDFLGVNYYTRDVVHAANADPLRAESRVPDAAERTAMGWEVHPESLRELLLRLDREYGPIPLLVTENGAAYDDTPDEDGYVADHDRLSYLERHVAALADAVREGARVEGYLLWSLLDNFEWADGYTKRFGIVRVDYETQRRTVKASGEWYRSLVETWRAARLDGAGSTRSAGR
jgi:beta-glucosidase